ncbi:MAG: alpha/beta hydrolase-fold protein [Bacteroidales bacterium]|nr:alpha/beta hydrolase-fold protein [Bacteroidales bacterium]
MKYSCLLIISLFFCVSTEGQNGKVYDNLSFTSSILNSERKYAVYLPPGYENSQRSYPVLYLLHGAGDDQTGWIQFGEVRHIADKAIKEGRATPMVIIMPDAHTGGRGYLNDIANEWRYEDFFFEELIPYVENEYRIKSEKRYRAVAGLSMGGGGSFMYALHRPEMFSSACPLSAYIGHLSFDAFKERFAGDNADYSDTELRDYFEKHNALLLIENLAPEKIKSVRWYIDCGDDDFLFEGNSLVHIAMRKKEIPHEYRVRDGGHTWTYWRTALPEVLSFVSQSFHQY